jgi:hypothetical protein
MLFLYLYANKRKESTNLGRNVVGRSAKSIGCDTINDALFAHAKVGNLAMALAVE